MGMSMSMSMGMDISLVFHFPSFHFESRLFPFFLFFPFFQETILVDLLPFYSSIHPDLFLSSVESLIIPFPF
jgi:hypothetical protein